MRNQHMCWWGCRELQSIWRCLSKLPTHMPWSSRFCFYKLHYSCMCPWNKAVLTMSLLIKHTCQHRNQQGYVKTHTAPETLGSCEEQQGFFFFFFLMWMHTFLLICIVSNLKTDICVTKTKKERRYLFLVALVSVDISEENIYSDYSWYEVA